MSGIYELEKGLLVLRTEFDVLARQVESNKITAQDVREKQAELKQQIAGLEQQLKDVKESDHFILKLLRELNSIQGIGKLAAIVLSALLIYWVVVQDGITKLLGG